MIEIDNEAARRFLLSHQHLNGAGKLVSDGEIVSFVKKVGCIQYDPLNKVARNADLVLQSRCEKYSEASKGIIFITSMRRALKKISTKTSKKSSSIISSPSRRIDPCTVNFLFRRYSIQGRQADEE